MRGRFTLVYSATRQIRVFRVHATIAMQLQQAILPALYCPYIAYGQK